MEILAIFSDLLNPRFPFPKSQHQIQEEKGLLMKDFIYISTLSLFISISGFSGTKKIDADALKITSVSQYTCVTRMGESDPNTRSNYFNLKATNHYYFEENTKPLVRAYDSYLYCHDIDQYGPEDKINIPRLELIPKVFNLWDQTDIRFSDTNGDGEMDINNLINNEMLAGWNVNARTNYFIPLKWPSYPGQETHATLGYMMKVFIDRNTGEGKCPTQEDYFSPDKTFQALRSFVGEDTEAIYIGVRQNEEITNFDGTTTGIPGDIILIKESDLKKIWFYYENNLAFKPDEVTSRQKTLYFFYPPAPDFQNPFIRRSYQSLYTVIDRNSIPGYFEEGGSAAQGLPSYEKKFGCIPIGTFLKSPPIMESDKGEGNRVPGEACKFDYDCSSFCCNKSIGACGNQMITEQETILCSKAPGETCLTREYCQKEKIKECKIIKRGTGSNGKLNCELKCFTIEEFGSCRNGICESPIPSPIPEFDSNNPDCSNAEELPL